ncbi:MAG: hypothetical protein C0482_24375 [Gordonia sp.]|jgi:NAD(P)-dependent dehydrogenase (short-subunit alcohol dehydrogenase family)|nr:hypothetical protein [Gordonia sp. (in: high G+C Gram-positive bacteria)]
MHDIVFITGGAIGFVRALTRSWAADAAAVVLADIDGAAAEATAAELRSAGGEALAVACDVADADAVAAAVEKSIETFGGVDVLVNNAALHLRKYSPPPWAKPDSLPEIADTLLY